MAIFVEMIIQALFFIIVYPFLVGVSLITILSQKENLFRPMDYLSSYLLGIGLITYILFLILLVVDNNYFIYLLILTIPLVMVSLILKKDFWKRILKIKLTIPPFRENILAYTILLLIILQMFYGYFRNLTMSPSSWDGFAMWAFKAKILYYSGLNALLTSGIDHLDYPLMNPMAQFYSYLSFGQFDEIAGKLFIPVLHSVFIGLFYFQIRNYLTIRASLLFTLILAIMKPISTHSTLAYADLQLMFFFTTAVFYLYEYLQSLRYKDFIISAILLGLCGWTKNEGLSYILVCQIVLFLYYVFNKRESWGILFRDIGSYFLISLIIYMPWLVYSKLHQLSVDLLTHKTITLSYILNHLSRIPIILWAFIKTMISPAFVFIWLFILLSHIIFFKRLIHDNIKYISLIILLSLGIFSTIYLITPHDIIWHLNTSIDRLVLQITPIALFIMVHLISDWYKQVIQY